MITMKLALRSIHSLKLMIFFKVHCVVAYFKVHCNKQASN